MVDFVFNKRSVLVWDLEKFRKKLISGGLHLQTPDALRLNPPSKLVTYWLAILRSQGKILKSPRPIRYECCIQNRPCLENIKFITKENSWSKKSVSEH